jgi:hypothetical protein
MSPFYIVQTASAANPVSYPIDIVAISEGERWPEREVLHSPPTSAEIKNM